MLDPKEYGKAIKVPITTLFRWYLYDITGEDANKHAELFKLFPVSKEGDDKELEDSEERLNKLVYLIPFIKLYADMNASLTFDTHRKEMLKRANLSEEMLNSSAEALKEFYSNMTFNGIVAVLSSAAELNLITLNGIIKKTRKETK
jgi:hypothetical protein